MASKLSVHKNTIEKKRNREVHQEISRFAKWAKDRDVRAYAIVIISGDGSSDCLWDTGSIMPIWSFPPTIHECLKRDIEDSGVEETWVPPLPLKG